MKDKEKPLRGSVQAFRESVWGPNGPVDELDEAMWGLSDEQKLKSWESVKAIMSSKSDKKLDFGKLIVFGTGGETNNHLWEKIYKGESITKEEYNNVKNPWKK